MATPHQDPTTTTTTTVPSPSQPTSTSSTSTSASTHQPTQPPQPPVELDSHPITPPPPSAAHQQSTSTDHDSTERRPSIYTDPESMAKLRAERSSDPAVVDGPAANEPAAEDFAVAAGLERGRGYGA